MGPVGRDPSNFGEHDTTSPQQRKLMIEILLLGSYLQTLINLSFHASAITNVDYVDVLFVFILLRTMYSVTFCSAEIKVFD